MCFSGEFGFMMVENFQLLIRSNPCNYVINKRHISKCFDQRNGQCVHYQYLDKGVLTIRGLIWDVTF